MNEHYEELIYGDYAKKSTSWLEKNTITIGMSLGIALGIVFDDIFAGITLGVALGLFMDYRKNHK